MDGRLSEILTGDKTGAHYFEPQIKIDKMQFRKRAKHPGITKKFQSIKKELSFSLIEVEAAMV